MMDVATQDPHEAAKANPALDKPMVLRSKDGSRSRRPCTEPSAPPRPATSSGVGRTSYLHKQTPTNQVACCGGACHCT